MNNEWKALPTMMSVAQAQADGWEIQVSSHEVWVPWQKEMWLTGTQYRGRPKVPVKHVVTSECWRSKSDGALIWRAPEKSLDPEDWQRFPVGDFPGKVEA